MKTMNIDGVTIDEHIVESIRSIQELNESGWSDRILDKIVHFILNEGENSDFTEKDRLILIGEIFDMKDFLRPIKPIK